MILIFSPIKHRIMTNKSSDFWYFSRRERKATLLLLGAVTIVFLLPALYRFLPQPANEVDLLAFEAAIQDFESDHKTPISSEVEYALFSFDPNTAEKETLERLGLPAATVTTLLNYRKKGGRFRSAADLSRIYNLAPADFARLEPYVRIGTAAAAAAAPHQKSQQTGALFSFDPNTLSASGFQELGLSEKVVQNLLRYREKGGQFHSKVDLKKIYGLSSNVYERLENYIQIPPTSSLHAVVPDKDSEEKTTAARAIPVAYELPAPVAIDINTADAGEWSRLYGIGPVLSERIVKFRDMLGGFVAIDQVAETFGLSDSTFQIIRPQLRFSQYIRAIRINQVGAEQLREHPYIKWQQAKVIVAYRNEHGPFSNLDDLRAVKALSEDFIQRIEPYLQFTE